MKSKNIPVTKIVLSTVAVIGLVSVAMIAPNALQALKIFGVGYSKKKYTQAQVNRSLYYLKNKGFIIFEDKKGQSFVRLTKKGQKKFKEYQQKNITIERPKQWDGKWRMIMFDIQEKRRGTRYGIRKDLVTLGFVRLQNSVWVFPFECRDVITMLKANHKIGKDVLYVVANDVDNDRHLRKIFNLL